MSPPMRLSLAGKLFLAVDGERREHRSGVNGSVPGRRLRAALRAGDDALSVLGDRRLEEGVRMGVLDATRSSANLVVQLTVFGEDNDGSEVVVTSDLDHTPVGDRHEIATVLAV